MPYTDEQIAFYNKKPTDVIRYRTIVLYNEVAGYKYLLVSGENGPYFNIDFDVDSVSQTFTPVSCMVPDTTEQDPDEVDVGLLTISRIGSEAREYIKTIQKSALTPDQLVITVRELHYLTGISDPIYDKTVYAGGGSNGITIGSDSVTMQLSVDNPAKIQFQPIYRADEYTGLQYG